MLSTPFETVALPDMKRPTYELVAQAKSPRSIITHLPWQFLPKQVTEQKKGKIIYIIRNPKDTLSSVCRFFLGGQDREEHIWPSLLQNFLEGEIPSGGWYEHVSEYLKHKDNKNVLIVSYEEMKLNFAQVAKSIAKFLGKDLDEEALKKVAESATVKGMKKSYDDMEKNIPGGEFVAKAMGNKLFIHKGVIGSWKNSFTVAENEMFDKIYGEKVASLGLDFIYEA
ncbi:Sulfotransferase 1A1 [Holothuria leucospilota]|uniref:Sulfotransferase 1A1 n=1 Tax=Holothuria leucospilota TaxID=206669 RepID=A0A9Q1C8G2_HOLLE|nr:Sulfotransferase 1A1 [Holothuria leucospilota]